MATHTANFPQAATLIYSFALIPRSNATVPITGTDFFSLVAKKEQTMPLPERKLFFPQLAPATKERVFPNALVEGTLTLTNSCLRITQANLFKVKYCFFANNPIVL